MHGGYPWGCLELSPTQERHSGCKAQTHRAGAFIPVSAPPQWCRPSLPPRDETHGKHAHGRARALGRALTLMLSFSSSERPWAVGIVTVCTAGKRRWVTSAGSCALHTAQGSCPPGACPSFPAPPQTHPGKTRRPSCRTLPSWPPLLFARWHQERCQLCNSQLTKYRTTLCRVAERYGPLTETPKRTFREAQPSVRTAA